jgi:spore maturation protein CgeB
VSYLPFGYDETLFNPPTQPLAVPEHDVLFVGGADKDRLAFMAAFSKSGPQITLVGSYWERFSKMRPFALGQKTSESLRALTAAAKVNLCLVRHANRDGNVMRSFEIAAIGGCMLAEDTVEHREIFGGDGEAVVYFRTPLEAAERAQALISSPADRARLSAAIRARIVSGKHTYSDRLAHILQSVFSQRRAISTSPQLSINASGRD